MLKGLVSAYLLTWISAKGIGGFRAIVGKFSAMRGDFTDNGGNFSAMIAKFRSILTKSILTKSPY